MPIFQTAHDQARHIMTSMTLVSAHLQESACVSHDRPCQSAQHLFAQLHDIIEMIALKTPGKEVPLIGSISRYNRFRRIRRNVQSLEHVAQMHNVKCGIMFAASQHSFSESQSSGSSSSGSLAAPEAFFQAEYLLDVAEKAEEAEDDVMLKAFDVLVMEEAEDDVVLKASDVDEVYELLMEDLRVNPPVHIYTAKN